MIVRQDNRTLIARLGFSDPDRKLPRHDLACQYLATDPVAYRVLKTAFPEGDPCVINEPIFEYPLSKGEGEYKVVVGFVDVILDSLFLDGADEWRRRVAVEVKITPTPVSEVIRQVLFYNSHKGFSPICDAGWIVATDYDLTENEQGMLASTGIKHVRLGPGFDEWIKTQGRTPGRMVEV